ncbi:MAG: hypothetical protein RSD57_17985 [Comamonas sp.]
MRSVPALALHAVPSAVWSYWLLGAWATPVIQLAQRRALRHSLPAVLKHRALQALRPPPLNLAALPVPLLALHATQDRLIPASGQASLAAAPQCEVVHIDGPYMLLQTVADACAPVVTRFVERCTTA